MYNVNEIISRAESLDPAKENLCDYYPPDVVYAAICVAQMLGSSGINYIKGRWFDEGPCQKPDSSELSFSELAIYGVTFRHSEMVYVLDALGVALRSFSNYPPLGVDGGISFNDCVAQAFISADDASADPKYKDVDFTYLLGHWLMYRRRSTIALDGRYRHGESGNLDADRVVLTYRVSDGWTLDTLSDGLLASILSADSRIRAVRLVDGVLHLDASSVSSRTISLLPPSRALVIDSANKVDWDEFFREVSEIIRGSFKYGSNNRTLVLFWNVLRIAQHLGRLDSEPVRKIQQAWLLHAEPETVRALLFPMLSAVQSGEPFSAVFNNPIKYHVYTSLYSIGA